MSTKAALRASFSTARKAMPDEARFAARAAVCAAVLDRAGGWRSVAAYEPLRSEPGSIELLSGLAALGIRVIVPVTLADNDLDWTEWGTGVRLGVSAVASVDAVLVPALAVALDGTRLGRGGGSYDRALRRCAPGALRAALLFDGELVPSLPRDPWDEPVTAVVQPSGWHGVGTRPA